MCRGKLPDSIVNNLQMLVTVRTVSVCYFIAMETLNISIIIYSTCSLSFKGVHGT